MRAESDLQWTLLQETEVFTGYTRVVRRTFRMPDGSIADWDVVAGERSVAVVARTVTGDFLLVRQFRAGPARVLLELPGGYVDDGELVLDAARRELREETGYDAGSVDVVGRTWLAAGSQLEQYCVLALDCTPGGAAQRDDLEFQQVVSVSPGRFVEGVRAGGMTDAGLAMLALDWMGLLASEPLRS